MTKSTYNSTQAILLAKSTCKWMLFKYQVDVVISHHIARSTLLILAQIFPSTWLPALLSKTQVNCFHHVKLCKVHAVHLSSLAVFISAQALHLFIVCCRSVSFMAASTGETEEVAMWFFEMDPFLRNGCVAEEPASSPAGSQQIRFFFHLPLSLFVGFYPLFSQRLFYLNLFLLFLKAQASQLWILPTR